MRRLASLPRRCLLASIVLFVSACGDSDSFPATTTEAAADSTVLLSTGVVGTWRPSAEMGDTFPSGREVLVLSADGSIAGVTACNNLFGSYVVTDGELVIVELGATEQLCDEPLGSQQRAFEDPIRSGDPTVADSQLRFAFEGRDLVLEKAEPGG